MPLRFYDNNDWRSPTSIRIYDNSSWQDATIGYVYDLGVWRVVFPDPIIPVIEFTNTYSGLSYLTNPPIREIGAEVVVTNGTGQIFAELFLGSTPSGTPIATQNVSAYLVQGNQRYYNPDFTSYSFTNNQNYCIRVTANSITENQSVLSSGPIYLGIPSVNITSYSVSSSNNSFSVSWSSENQSRWRVTVAPTGPGAPAHESNGGLFTTSNATSYSAAISPPLLSNTQYYIKVEIQATSFDEVEDQEIFTSNVVNTAEVNITSTSATCSTISVGWTALNSPTGEARIYDVYFGTPQFPETVYEEIISKRFNWTSERSHTFTGLSSDFPYRVEIQGKNSSGEFGPISGTLLYTQGASVSTPTNFSASSDYHGILASFSWTAATANCTTVTGYRIEYKLNTDSTWAILSDSIAANATTFSAGGIGTSTFLPGRTYNFRIYAKSSFGLSPVSSAINLTMNNNPYNISISGTSTITTFSSSILTAQIRNAAYENISASGFTISWSFVGGINPPSGSSISPASSVTNSSGQATATFTSGSDDGTGTVFATTPNLGPLEGGQRTMTVILSTGLTPSLTGSGTTKGVSFTNSNHSALYSYTNDVGYPSIGSLEAGDSYNSSQFDILITRTRSARNTISRSGNTATTTNSTFDANPLVSMRIISSRTGYTSQNSNISTVTAAVSITSRSYEWQQFTNSTWNTNFGAAFSGTTSQTLSWSSTTFTSRQIRCIVTTNFSSGQVDTSTSENTITIP
jgi:hypothetical protein